MNYFYTINDNLVEQLKTHNLKFKISTFQGMEEAIEWYIESIGNQ